MKPSSLGFLLLVVLIGSATGAIAPEQKSNEISPEVMNAINAMSKSVGGTGYVLGLGWNDLPSGRELQMKVKDGGGRLWVLGVDQATAKPRTRICVALDGTLAVVDDKMEPKYGSVSGQPISTAVGHAINGQLVILAQQSKRPVRIKTVTISGEENSVYTVSWESADGSGDGTFAVNAEGKPAPSKK
jgi:hypothetical protein